ncbi:hypothetical protein B0T25DRAFT_530412 [Lasiosphaeria hispida]|uniref:Uncharacterized protein n=1 Tax=Lasiosphaeria hispida TaxID=260671 RepID=A0AAJ0HXJ4_9PEZI|nr:hypothetical protein B0T25DRAFT_530412 [Lasiosphaeria hispida]
MLMYITPKASGFFDNMWLWVADHIIDDEDLTNNNSFMMVVFTAPAASSSRARRPLGSTALRPSTSSEHNVFY